MLNRRERKVKNVLSAVLNDSEGSDDIDQLISTKWNIQEKIMSNRHSAKLSKKYDDGKNFSKQVFENEGFSTPILFVKSDGLGLNVPTSDFGVNDVEINVGKDRVLDVVDVNTQDAIGMTMREWCRYYNNPTKNRLLNVISLEYSQTKMDDIVRAPNVVLEIDWLESCWPKNCRDISVDNQSHLKSMTYPKVRKYCLMSVNGCYTDFHIDLGGTSVWYHIFKGEKIFWMVPPTEENLNIFEKWCLSTDQTSYFFPDLVDKCEKVHLKQGNTFLIPSGWIHGVYTPVDSLVFGGNFLHSFSIEKQIRIWNVEERIKVGMKYRYPFFVEMHWYVLATLVSKVNGKGYIIKTDKQDQKYKFNSQNSVSFIRSKLNDYEMIGLYIIYQWISDHATTHCKLVPNKITNVKELLLDAECIVNRLPLVPSNSYAYQELQLHISKLMNFQEKNIKKTSSTSLELISALPAADHLSVTSAEKKSKVIGSKKLSSAPLRKPSTPAKSKKIKKVKLECALTSEIPLKMYDKILVARKGAREIKRPHRLIETTYK